MEPFISDWPSDCSASQNLFPIPARCRKKDYALSFFNLSFTLKPTLNPFCRIQAGRSHGSEANLLFLLKRYMGL